MWMLRKELEIRKENLIFTLKSKKDFLELEKQHQIYGAIKELDHVLGLIEHHREEEVMNKPRKLVLNNDITGEESVMKEKKRKTIKFKSPLKIKFAKSDA
ncbi:hypothetical protein KY348_02840 [Candidatus Woesearchaeota archaeon]|nr:hypothetical protein [Candidatus Woesearchaeota archaeon]